MTENLITKIDYINGIKCSKAMWLNYKGIKGSNLSLMELARLEAGVEVENLAKKYFNNSIEVKNGEWNLKFDEKNTKKYINEGYDTILQACAFHKNNNIFCRIDVLRRVDDNKWDLIEIKSSTSIKNHHIDDISYQYYVFKGAGYNINKCFLMLVNKEYVRNGDINIKEYFIMEDVTERVLENFKNIDKKIIEIKNVLEQPKEPDISIGDKCFKPFLCEYKKECWKNVPEYSIYNLFTKAKAEKIEKEYGNDIKNLPEDFKLTENQQIKASSYIHNKAHVNSKKISEFLNKIKYPIYYLDYETICPAIPLFDGTKPYQQVPFQFSLHVQQEHNGDLTHYEFLHKDKSDPRKLFVENLIKLCGNTGSVIIYHQTFEEGCNNDLSNYFPEYANDIIKINSRMVDLIIPFKKFWLYHPDQMGSTSIKKVLPCFTNLTYDNLNDIKNGTDAMIQYENFIKGKIPEENLKELWINFTEYCKLDTYAMYLLLDALWNKSYEK